MSRIFLFYHAKNKSHATDSDNYESCDLIYEFQFAHMNRRLAPSVDTVFFMTDERNHYVSSSLVKEVASLGGDVSGLVPASVAAALAQKYAAKSATK